MNLLGCATVRKLRLTKRVRAEGGQTVLEWMMLTGFVVTIAVFVNALLTPVVIKAFQSVAEAVSAIGP
jgi:hypothetical protein